MPGNDLDAAKHLESVLNLTASELRRLTKAEFLQAWDALFFLYPGLHPDETEHGTELDHHLDQQDLEGEVCERLLRPSYVTSGWPVGLVPLLSEAWRRHKVDLLELREVYPVEAQHAGIEWRKK